MKPKSSPWEYKAGLAAVERMSAASALPSLESCLNMHAADGWEPFHIGALPQSGGAVLLVMRRPFKRPQPEPVHGEAETKAEG